MVCTLFCLLLTACGGASSGNSASDGSTTTTTSSTAKHDVFYNASTAKMNVQLAVDSGNVVNIIRSGGTVKASFANISSVYWNDGCNGWHKGGKGVPASLSPLNKTTLNVGVGGIGLFSVIEKGGIESFLNIDYINMSGKAYYLDKQNGVIYFGSATVRNPNGTYGPNSNFSCGDTSSGTGTGGITTVDTSTMTHQISISNGDLQVKFAASSGIIVNLVKNGVPATLDTTKVHRIFWNGDVALWSLADNASYSGPLTLPTTGLTIPAHDNGIIRIVDTSGGVYSIDTSKCAFDLNAKLSTDGRQLITF